MLQTKKITNDLCAISFDPTEIMVRKSGKQYFGKEKTLVKLDNEGLVIDEDVAKEFGIKIFSDALKEITLVEQTDELIQELRCHARHSKDGKMGDECTVPKSLLADAADKLENFLNDATKR